MTDTPPKPKRPWRWLVVLILLCTFSVVGVFIGLPYYRWAQLISIRGSLRELHTKVLPVVNSAFAKPDESQWLRLQRATADVLVRYPYSAAGSWAVCRLDHVVARDGSLVPLVLVLIDRGTRASLSCATIVNSRISLAPLDASGPEVVKLNPDSIDAGERLIVLFVDGEITQMTARDLVERLQHPDR